MPQYGYHGTTTHRRTMRQHHAQRRQVRSKSHRHKHGYHLKHPRKKGQKHPHRGARRAKR